MRYLLSVAFVTATLYCFAQPEIPVDMYTGTPSIIVPLYSVSHGDVSAAFALSYNANGVQNYDSRGLYGLNWSLRGEGAIQRTVRGLPDDFAGTAQDDNRRGWLYGSTLTPNGVAQDVAAFTSTSDNTSTSCTDETTDYNAISAFKNALIDTEPDLFTFDFAGYSGSFVFDNSNTPQIRFIPFKDFAISYTTASPTDKTITSFTILTNNGFKYVFGQAVGVSKWAAKVRTQDQVTFLEREYKLYEKYTGFNASWKLTRIESPSGAFINFTYSATGLENLPDYDIVVGIADRTSGTIPVTAYRIKQSAQQVRLTQVTSSSGQQIEFVTSGDLTREVVFKDSRRGVGNEFVKKTVLLYEYGKELFLSKAFEVSGCDRLPAYTFEYVGGFTYEFNRGKDYWGYYNGKEASPGVRAFPKTFIYPDEVNPVDRYRLYPIPNYSGTEIILNGVDRMPDENLAKVGALSKITYPAGGGVLLEYESHKYYDARTQTTQLGGGLRIKSLAYFDGTNNVRTVTKEFSYTNPLNNQSSGVLVSRPSFVMPAWKYRDPGSINDASLEQSYSQILSKSLAERYRLLLIRSEEDLSDGQRTHGSTVGYQYVTVKRIGEGSATFEFSIPGTYGESSATNWVATENKFARPADCPTMGIVQSSAIWSFPYAPLPELDHERGLIFKKWEYDESHTLIRYTQNDYQYLYKTGNQPVNVWGLYHDLYPNSPNIQFFGRYFLPTDYDKVLSKETITTYDKTSSSRAGTESAEYFYESAFHKLITRVKSTGVDGKEFTTRYKYVLDYSIPSNSEPWLLRIKDLQDATRFRHGSVIEQVSSVKQPGDVEKVASASIFKFDDFSQAGKVYVQSEMFAYLPSPVADFVSSITELVGATYKMKFDSRYASVKTNLSYSSYSIPTSSTDQSRITNTIVLGYDGVTPVATIAGAGVAEVAFSDFETVTTNSFDVTNDYPAIPRTGARGINPNSTLRKSITKASDASNYIFSFYYKGSETLSQKLEIKSADLTTTYFSDVLTVNPSPDKFSRTVKKIAVANLPASFIIQFNSVWGSPPAGAPVLSTPSLDDIAFYPEESSINYYTYTFPFGAASVTNSQGITSYVEYDNLGREKLLYDHNRNIVRRNTYTFTSATPDIIADFSLPDEIFTNQTYTITAVDNNCFSGVVYDWSIGQVPAPTFTTGAITKTYSFSAAGNYYISLRVTYGAVVRTITKKIAVKAKDIGVQLCVNGAVRYNCSTESYWENQCTENAVPPAGGGTYFYATVAEAISGLTYQWEKSYAGTDTWFAISGATSSHYEMTTFINPKSTSFNIRCKVTSPDGRQGFVSRLIDVIPCN